MLMCGVVFVLLIQGFFGFGCYCNDMVVMIFGGIFLVNDWEVVYCVNYIEMDLVVDLLLLLFIQIDFFVVFLVVYDYLDLDFLDIDFFDMFVGVDGFGFGSMWFDMILQLGYGLDLIINVFFLQFSENMLFVFDILWLLGMILILWFGLQFDFCEWQGCDLIDVVFVGFFFEVIGVDFIDYVSFVMDQGWDIDFLECFGVSFFDNVGFCGEVLCVFGVFQGVGFFFGEVVFFDLWSVEEDIFVGYVMNIWQYFWGSFIVGLCVEQWNFDSVGQFQGEDGEIQLIVVNNDEMQFFLSVYVNVDV